MLESTDRCPSGSPTSDKIVVRRFINSAIYVEKEMSPSRKTSALSLAGTDEGYQTEKSVSSESLKRAPLGHLTPKIKPAKAKSVRKCTCILGATQCQCHQQPAEPARRKKTVDFSDKNSTTSSSSVDTQITIINKSPKSKMSTESLLSSTSLLSSAMDSSLFIDQDPKEKEEQFKKWLKNKEQQKKAKKLEEQRQQKLNKEKEAMLLEQKEAVYKDWLERKKQQEENLKKQKEREKKKSKKMEEEKKRKLVNNKEIFDAWLKIKAEKQTEAKMKAKKKEDEKAELKKGRLEQSQRAFSDWLKHSKDKPKPVPSNQGLSSLYLTDLVAYVNPEPWVGN
ncbi:unnamed protein product [Phyllotreta striolata]|uniref:Coiled-coil domain-containing protein n=1 Tax=Phyllotreta striolata TaxID=444603 RepID=A0A9N9U244_PHYSR|nr:unnamed protein product [Phyllotreta striolata]